MTEAARAGTADLWDNAMPGMWYLHSAPSRLGDLWTEEQNTLYIREDLGSYWLERPGIAGQDRFDSLEEAKKAGEAVHDREWAEMPGRMLADAGLDPSEWSFEYGDGARFKSLRDASLVIEIAIPEGHDRKDRFEAFEGDDGLGSHETASAAAEVLANRAAPRI